VPIEPHLNDAGQLAFPCDFPFKAMTRCRDQALEQVLAVLRRQQLHIDRERIRIRPSRNGRYQSITIEARVESRDQLEAAYLALRGLDIVVMTL